MSAAMRGVRAAAFPILLLAAAARAEPAPPVASAPVLSAEVDLDGDGVEDLARLVYSAEPDAETGADLDLEIWRAPFGDAPEAIARAAARSAAELELQVGGDGGPGLLTVVMRDPDGGSGAERYAIELDGDGPVVVAYSFESGALSFEEQVDPSMRDCRLDFVAGYIQRNQVVVQIPRERFALGPGSATLRRLRTRCFG